jgi:hypothetical protein
MTTYSTNTATQSKSTWIETFKERVKTVTKTAEFRILTVMLTALMLWGAAIAVFGYPALILVALAFVPIIFFCLIMITLGK